MDRYCHRSVSFTTVDAFLSLTSICSHEIILSLENYDNKFATAMQ